MLLNGADLEDQASISSQAILTVSNHSFQLQETCIISAKSRHTLDLEPPLPLYIGMKIHTKTRSKKFITQSYELGLSVSYDRVLQVESKLAPAVCENFREKGVVVPAQLRHGCLLLVRLITWIIILQAQLLKVHFMGRGSVCSSYQLLLIWGKTECSQTAID